MENLRLEHFNLTGFKLHTCKSINSTGNVCMKSEEITHCAKKTPNLSLQWKMNIFFYLTKNLIYYQAIPFCCQIATGVISRSFNTSFAYSPQCVLQAGLCSRVGLTLPVISPGAELGHCSWLWDHTLTLKQQFQCNPATSKHVGSSKAQVSKRCAAPQCSGRNPTVLGLIQILPASQKWAVGGDGTLGTCSEEDTQWVWVGRTFQIAKIMMLAQLRVGWPNDERKQGSTSAGAMHHYCQFLPEYLLFSSILAENHPGNSLGDLQAHSSHGRGATRGWQGCPDLPDCKVSQACPR